MSLSRLLSVALFSLLVPCAAMAFNVDEKSTTSKDAAAQLGDPDDKVPYPHMADDGTMQGTPDKKQGLTFSVSQPNGSSTDAFARAQERFSH